MTIYMFNSFDETTQKLKSYFDKLCLIVVRIQNAFLT